MPGISPTVFFLLTFTIFILWEIKKHCEYGDLRDELEHLKRKIACKEEWELDKYDVQNAKCMIKERHDYVKMQGYFEMMRRIEKLENPEENT